MSVPAFRPGRLRPTGALAAAVAAAFLATAAAGCSSGADGGGGEESPDEPLSLAQARETYSDLADGLDAALDPFYDEYNRAAPSLPALQDAAEDVARASEEFAADLSAIAWPEEVDPAAVSVVAEDYEVYATQWEEVAAAADLGEVATLLCEMDADVGTAAENLNRLREDLDLEPVEWGVEDPNCASDRGDGGDRVFGDDHVTP